MRILRPATVIAALVVLSPLALLPLGAVGQNETDSNAETYRQLNLFGDVFEKVRADYVEPVGDEELIEAAINGMLTSLDPHSSYLNEDNFEDMQVQTRGEFGGLGIEVTLENGLVKVVSPIDDTPAFRAGVKPGDFITHLDGEPVMGMTLADAVERMRGPVDSEIKLTIRRGDREPFDVTLMRAVIKIQSVRHRLEGNIGYVRVTSFNEQTGSGIDSAFADFEKQLADKLDGVILDLRRNPGGLLDQAIAVSDAFLDKGEIVSTRGRKNEQTQRFNATPGDLANGLPLVVLIDGGSASASEIVAGALQDHRRAILLGTKSFGKGSVQTIIPVPGHGAIRLTTARYYTPSGRSIQALGIVPDIEVHQAKIEEIDDDIGRSEADLRGALQNENGAEEPTTDEAPPATDEAPPATDGSAPLPGADGGDEPPAEGEAAAGAVEDGQQDYQLARALDLLRGLALYSARSVN